MVAEKYNLPKLKAMAEKSLCKTLKLESVVWTAANAFIHNGQTVVTYATDMIVEKFAQVIEQPDWTDFMKNHSQLMVIVHKKLAKKTQAP